MTETQAKLLTYIRQCGAVTPTYREMAEHLGWASHGGVKAVLDALIKMGHIKRRKGADRGLTVVKEKAAWQPIATAPKDRTTFDCWLPDEVGGYRVTDLYFSARGLLMRGGAPADLAIWPTHWMPIPEAPQ